MRNGLLNLILPYFVMSVFKVLKLAYDNSAYVSLVDGIIAAVPLYICM